jgi:uncharacterized protein YjiK
MWNLIIITLGVTLFTGCAQVTSQPDPHTSPFPGHKIVNIDLHYCQEPSGIVFSEQRGTLFVAGDEGDICELTLDGALLNRRSGEMDLEGITLDPSSGLLYAIEERTGTIFELDPQTLELVRRFTLDPSCKGYTLSRHAANNGMEAITFKPDTRHPAGGTFYVANQGSMGNQGNLPLIFEINVPLHITAAADQAAHIIRCFQPGVTDLSGIHYDNQLNRLLVISDTHDNLMVTTVDGKTLASYALPGKHQEGITRDDQGKLYIAEDSGGIIKYTFNPEL